MKSPDIKPYVVIHAPVIIMPRAHSHNEYVVPALRSDYTKSFGGCHFFSVANLLYNAFRPFFQGRASERSEFSGNFLFIPIPARPRLIIEPSRIVSGFSSTIFSPAT